jgi:hypothetical protein
MFEAATRMAEGAALMTDTKFEGVRIFGSACDIHMSKPVAFRIQENIARVGMPQWSADDQAFAKALQRELGVTQEGLHTAVTPLLSPDDKPAIELNAAIMAQWREKMRPFYYDASKHATYLEQLGITYPTIRATPVP